MILNKKNFEKLSFLQKKNLNVPYTRKLLFYSENYNYTINTIRISKNLKIKEKLDAYY